MRAVGAEAGRGIEPAERDDIAVDFRAVGDGRGSTDDHEMSVDFGGLAQLRVSEHDHDVFGDVPFDGRVAANHDDRSGGFASSEGEALEDAHRRVPEFPPRKLRLLRVK